MGRLKSLINGKSAFQSARLDDIYFPISEEQRAQLQSIIFKMYEDILDVSKDEGLTPFLVGGSALGAIRHGGFIPWDDDLDIGFLRNEYERFLNAFEERYSDRYYVNSPGKQNRTRARFTKILKKGTIFRDMISLPEDELNGVFVDVFPIDNVPDKALIRRLKGIRCDLLAYISSQVFNRENMTPELKTAFKRTGKANYYIRMAVGFVFGLRKSSWWFKRYDRVAQYKDNATEFCTIAAGRKHYFGEILRRNMIQPARYIQFGELSAPVFYNVEGYLSQMYGDYMKIPSVDKRERHYIKELKI